MRVVQSRCLREVREYRLGDAGAVEKRQADGCFLACGQVGGGLSRLRRLELIFSQVVPAAHGACHLRTFLRARSASILLLERLQLSGQRNVAEHIANPAREITTRDVPGQ